MAENGRVRNLLLVAGDRLVYERLRSRYPELRVTEEGAEIPLDDSTPEEVLAVCGAEKVPVRHSAIRSG
jgi:hypothetical protein